jgi:hypothetical protein
MAALEALQRMKAGADAILQTALEQRDRPPDQHVPQAQQERLAADLLAAAKELDDAFERAKLACVTESEEEVQREVRRSASLMRSHCGCCTRWCIGMRPACR